jgi:hypothetical protein
MTLVMQGTPPLWSTDVLLVLDDRIPSSPHATKLEQALDRMMGNFEWPMSSGGLPIDLHVAILPAAVPAEAGSALPVAMWPTSPSCAGPTGPFLYATQRCDSNSNFSGSLSDAVVCASLHLAPSGQPPRLVDALRAMLGAGGPGDAAGFRRRDVQLIVAIVSTEDDPLLADADAVARAHDLVVDAAYDPRGSLMVVVVAPGSAPGLAAFAESFGDNGELTEISASDWWSLPATTERIASKKGFPCLEGPLVDTRLDLEGIQPDCVATEIHISTGEGTNLVRTEAILAPCPDNPAPTDHCWRTEQNRLHCPTGAPELIVEPRALTCLPSYAVKYGLTCATRLP